MVLSLLSQMPPTPTPPTRLEQALANLADTVANIDTDSELVNLWKDFATSFATLVTTIIQTKQQDTNTTTVPMSPPPPPSTPSPLPTQLTSPPLPPPIPSPHPHNATPYLRPPKHNVPFFSVSKPRDWQFEAAQFISFYNVTHMVALRVTGDATYWYQHRFKWKDKEINVGKEKFSDLEDKVHFNDGGIDTIPPTDHDTSGPINDPLGWPKHNVKKLAHYGSKTSQLLAHAWLLERGMAS